MKWVRVINGLMLLLALGLVMQLQQYRATAGANQFPFQMVMFDVGEGDAVLIKSEAGSALIDAGPDVGIVSDLSQALPDKKLDYLVITHPHADHIGQAVSVLRHFQVGKIIYTGVQYESQVYQDFISETQQKNIPLEAVDQNSDWQMGDVTFDVLYPKASIKDQATTPQTVNDSSIVIRVRYGEFDAILPGDASSKIEDEIVSDVANPIEVLQVGHQGSQTSTGMMLVSVLRPKVALISVGVDNSYGHPHPSIISRLEAIGAKILRTDQNGTIKVLSDGEKFYVRSEKVPAKN